MKILILGGTVFLGRALVDAAIARGHAVTLFNRGQHNPQLYPEIEKLRGDRDGGLDVLRGRRWDAAIDTNGYFPRLVRASAEALADSVDHYTFISSISVFADFKAIGMDESAPVGTIADETIEQITGESYGPLKALCEQAAERAMPGCALNIRPGLIVGPHDPSDRFTYWPVRVAGGGEVLAPGRPERPVQIIDVRDLAEWNIRLVESHTTGIFNATGPDYELSMGQILDTSKAVTGSDAHFTWVSEQFLQEQGGTPWTEVTLWVPEKDNEGLSTVNVQKALGAGLTFRPLADTIRATLDWDATRPSGAERRNGIKPEREQAWLSAWHRL
jgi:nucleoside-diphosphate-sugar epimerase